LQLFVVTQLRARTAVGQSRLPSAFLRIISTSASGGGKSQVVVGSQVQTAGLRPGKFETPTIIIGHTILQGELVPRNTAYGSIPTILNPPVNVSRVEALEGIVQSHITFATLLGGHFGHEEQLVDVAQNHQKIESQVRKAGRMQGNLLEGGLLKVLEFRREFALRLVGLGLLISQTGGMSIGYRLLFRMIVNQAGFLLEGKERTTIIS